MKSHYWIILFIFILFLVLPPFIKAIIKRLKSSFPDFFADWFDNYLGAFFVAILILVISLSITIVRFQDCIYKQVVISSLQYKIHKSYRHGTTYITELTFEGDDRVYTINGGDSYSFYYTKFKNEVKTSDYVTIGLIEDEIYFVSKNNSSYFDSYVREAGQRSTKTFSAVISIFIYLITSLVLFTHHLDKLTKKHTIFVILLGILMIFLAIYHYMSVTEPPI